jgi:hypothetical protein
MGRNKRACRVWIRECAECPRLFVGRHPSHLRCSPGCAAKHHNRNDDYHRWKRGNRRTITRESDITPQQEAGMRRRARKCRMCGAWLTSKPGQPNSKHLDHIVPVNVGGTHTHGNVRIICRLCNLKRPKDGSDYTGPITLWATAPGVVLVAKPPPLPPKPRIVAAHCACSADIHVKAHGGAASRCHDCLVQLGQDAALLRAAGMKWREIGTVLDYASLGSLHGLASRYGRQAA